MTRGALIILRAMGIAWGYAVTLGYLLLMRQSWIDPRLHSETLASRFQITAKTAWFLSPYIVLTASLFALITIPLAAWAVGSARWSSLKSYIYVFWSVLALFIVVSGNADGVILISGAGLITLWLLRNRGGFNAARIHWKDCVRIQVPLRSADSRRNITVFAMLAVIAFALSLFLFFGNRTKIYASEIFAIYAVACVCQGLETFPVIVRDQNAIPEKTP